ncbi:hypothetical protein [Streptomyces sp. NPDC020681]|uniref:hypothetical protein n=1 Tax=Streptomyces sp. NPDC020681 TaxID=3365083 RepID=UPI0037A4FBA8
MTSRSDSDTERLREVFADTVRDITPSPLPLTSIARAARTRRRRQAAGLAVCGALLLLAPFAATTFDFTSSSERVVVPPAATHTPTLRPSPPPPPSASPLRVVKPGQRVQTGPGAELWLTKDGKYWSTPEQPDQFRSVVDGNLDTSDPGISMQSESQNGRHVMTGVYYGTRDVGRVEITTATGPLVATVVTLTGRPGWGAWYATAQSPDPNDEKFLRMITLYDRSGKKLADLPQY